MRITANRIELSLTRDEATDLAAALRNTCECQDKESANVERIRKALEQATTTTTGDNKRGPDRVAISVVSSVTP